MSHPVDDLSTLGSMGAVLRDLASAPPELLVRGTLVDGQFEIDRVLGSGAMGVVYLARDRRLERNVAVKLVKDASPHALARASREAVSLARLSHPNVVVIHQVGEVGGRVYVAMEYVAGTNAREWAAAKPRTIREVLDVYLAVGDGLAAAHAAGLIHRDFKPDNVLVGDDGRARVADFGLARSDSTRIPALGAGAVTQLAGTPAYMAPEQLRGEEIDARADQYAYCATVWEALHGVRPFDYTARPSGTASTLDAGLVTDAPTVDDRPGTKQRPVKREPRRGDRKVPRRIELVLLRGLADSREERWPAMEPLLAELRKDPRRRTTALAAGLALVAVGGAAAFALHARTPDACETGAAQIRDVWNPQQQARVLAGLAPAGAAPWVVAQAKAAARAAETWSDRWGASYRSVCRAGWSSSLAERGTICLARARRDFAATLEAFASGKLDAVKIAAALDQLPRAESCTDAEYVAAETPPPANPVLAAQVASALADMHRVMLEGHSDDAARVLDQIEALHLDDPPLAAELHEKRALLAFGKGDKTALDLLRDSYFEARAAGARAIAATAALDLVPIALDETKDADAALWSKLGSVEAIAIADPAIQQRALSARGLVATAQNRPDEAIELFTKGLAIAAQANLDPVLLYQERGDAYDHAGKGALAIADFDQALAEVRATFGETHPRASILYQLRSLALVHTGRVDEAVADARKGLAIAKLVDPANQGLYANAQGSLGVALIEARQFDEALSLLDASIAAEAQKDPRSYNCASDHNNRCELLGKMHRDAEAVAECKLAASIFTEVVGDNSTEVASTEINQAVIVVETDPAAALLPASHALAILRGHTDDANVIIPLMIRATAYRELGKWTELKGDLDAAAAYLGKAGSPDTPFEYALERAYLAKHDRAPEQRDYATTARDGFARRGDHDRAAEAAKLIP